MSQEIRRILIVAGGTGGHLFPAIGLAEALKEKGITEIFFVCSDRQLDIEILKRYGYEFFISRVRPFKKGIGGLLIFIFALLLGCIQSLFVFLKFKPQVCVGFGGYVSVPFIILARVLGVEPLIHEQNFAPGKANRLLANFAKKIAVSFENTKSFFPNKKAVFTGNPVRKFILDSTEEEAYGFLGFDREKFTVLIMGGSQGSHAINMVLPRAIFLIDPVLRSNFQIIHLAGEADVFLVDRAYKTCGINYKVFSFSDKMGLFYRISGLVIARAGATTIAEIVAMKIPSILIPYPYADGHQRLNAKFLERCGAAIVLEQNKISEELLAQKISRIFCDNFQLSRMRDSLEKLSNKNATGQLAEEVLSWGY